VLQFIDVGEPFQLHPAPLTATALGTSGSGQPDTVGGYHGAFQPLDDAYIRLRQLHPDNTVRHHPGSAPPGISGPDTGFMDRSDAASVISGLSAAAAASGGGGGGELTSHGRLTVEDVYIEAMTLDAEIRVFRRRIDDCDRLELTRIIDWCRDALHRKLLLQACAMTRRRRTASNSSLASTETAV
jgi:hypothetical protein